MGNSRGLVGTQEVLWALNNPSALRRFLRERTRHLRRLLSKGDIAGGLYYLPCYLSSDTRFFSRYLARISSDGLVQVSCGDFDLFVRHDDIGIGHELYITGTHEPRTTRVYRNQIQELRNNVTNFLVVEIGANIGYMTLTTLVEVPEATIYSIEPIPQNVALLERNLQLNGYSDNVNVTEGAISATNGNAELTVTMASNKGAIRDHEELAGTTIPVDTWTIKSFADKVGIDPDDVNVIRMDIEGHESTLFFNGFADFLDQTSQPFLLLIELHPIVMDDDVCRALLDFLNDRFRLISGYQHTGTGILLDSINNIGDIAARDLACVELVLRKDES